MENDDCFADGGGRVRERGRVVGGYGVDGGGREGEGRGG